MRKVACLMGLLLLVSVTAKAQDTSKAEVFGGYSYLRYSPGGSQGSLNFNGGIGSVAYNVSNMFAVVGELGGYHNSNVYGSGASVNTLSYLFGPKVYMSKGKITPFAQALFGGIHASCSNCESNPSANALGIALGGGLDYDVTSRVAVRLGQIDYVLSRFSANSGYSNGNGKQNSFRYSAGVVFKF
jgi:opacity protein-like surface antigen